MSPFGNVFRSRNGRYQTRYQGPDGRRHSAGSFATIEEARAKLDSVRASIDVGTWRAPKRRSARPKSVGHRPERHVEHCPICAHPDREQIDALLDEGRPHVVNALHNLRAADYADHRAGHLESSAAHFAQEADLDALATFDPTRVRLTGLRVPEWPEEAACAGRVDAKVDPWHPDDRLAAPARRVLVQFARATCEGCPVRTQCLALGLALLPAGDVHGMHAGLTPDELRTVARARGMADRKVAQHGTRARFVTGCTCRPCLRAHADYYRQQRAEERWAASVKPSTPSYAEAG